jgi:hypothetical protein
MRILDIVKPDLEGVRSDIARQLRTIRKSNPEEARRRLKRFQLGMAEMEASLNYNLYHGGTGGGLQTLLEDSKN